MTPAIIGALLLDPGMLVNLRDTLPGITTTTSAREPGSPARLRTPATTRTSKIIFSSENTCGSRP